MPFLCVRVKINNGVGCLTLRGMFCFILNHGKLPSCGSTHSPEFRTGFWVGNKGNLVVSPLVNCSHISELDVRHLNFSIRTSVAQVIVCLP